MNRPNRNIDRRGAWARRTLMSCFVITGVVTPPLAAQNGNGRIPRPEVTERPATQLLAELRQGTLVLACRHTHTDRSRGDSRPVDFADRSRQRNLSRRGERDARAFGRTLQDLNVPVGQILASPYARTFETAELAFGRADTTHALFGQVDRRTIGLFARVVDGGNRVLMTHGYMLNRALRGYERGNIDEGDCVVVRPQGGLRFTILGLIHLDDWNAMTN